MSSSPSNLPINPEITDPLGLVLHSLRVQGVFYCRSELSGDWGLAMPQAPGCMWFHVGLTGRCDIESDEFDRVELTPGGFVLVTRGVGHDLSSTPAAERPDVVGLPHEYENENYAVLRYGEGPVTTTLVCGMIRLASHVGQELIDALPPVIAMDGLDNLQSEWMQSSIRLMAAESKSMSPGGDTIVTRLCDILVIQALRRWLETSDDAQKGWLGALKDPSIGRAMSAVHKDPEVSWDLETMAATAGMSRSAFAARFASLVGRTPVKYATEVRMRRAQELLSDPNNSVAELAWRFGYNSEASFHRAFKRVVGIPPGKYRRAASA